MIKRILQTIARSILVVAVLCGLLPLPAFTPVVQASKVEHVVQVQPSQSGKYASDHVLVKLRAPVLATAQSMGKGITGNNKLDLTLTQAGGRGLKPVFAASKSPLKDPSGLGRIYRVDLKAGQNVEDTLALLQADPNVEYAEPDYVAQKITAPNDPQYPDQWGLAKIQAEGAWAQTNGSPSVIIAVVDSGIDLTHEDLEDNLWANPGEIPNNSIDDDNNGFIDDVQGWNFIAGSNDLMDDNGHGTLVAGIAAARTGNSKGIAGVCGLCKIMPVRVMSTSGSANYSDIAAGINYAVVKGAKVINLSLGGYANSKALQDAVDNALAQNIVVVAGAGNDNVSTPFYPAAYAGVISVAATDSADHKANFSNYGSWVKVSAPGVDVLTTALGGDYLLSSGTSQAGPFVSGLAGLLVTLHPDWTQAMVLGQLTHTGDGIDTLNPGFECQLGAGRINAIKALQPSYPILSYVGYNANGTANGRPDFNADATLTVSLANDWADALGVSAALSTTDSNVSVTTRTADFGDILSGQTKTNGIPYGIHIATAVGYNHVIPFSLAVSANGGAFTKTLNFTVTTRSSSQDVSGTITTSRTWTNDKIYIATTNIGIPPGVTLTIQPGTTVKFNAGFNLNVGGKLIADGTESQPIRFISNAATAWGRIYFDDSGPDAVVDGSGVYQSGSILRWVEMEGAGEGIACNSASPYLSHLALGGGGVNCTAGNTSVWITDSDVTGNVTINGIPDSPWQTRASMPTPRVDQTGATASNGKIYAVGGDSGFNVAKNEEYDPVSDTWASRADMPAGQWSQALAAATNGKIYSLANYGISDTVFEYDPATDVWTQRASMPTPRNHLGAVGASNGKIYAIGGENDSGYLDTVEEYDPATDTWAKRASMPTAMSYLGVTEASNGKIYAIGGHSSNNFGLTVDEYDPATDIWTKRANLPIAINTSATAAACNDRVYATGAGAMQEYNPATDTWRVRPSVPTGRWGLVIAASHGKVYAIGGYGNGRLGTNEEFDPGLNNIGSFNVRNTAIRSGNLSIQVDSQVLNSNIGGSITVGNSIPGYTSTVQNTIANGNITVNGFGTVADNTVSGGISIGSGMVDTNTLTGGGIVAGDGSTVQGNSIENAPGWAIDASGSVTITHNRIVGGVTGVRLQNGSAIGNLIADLSGTGLEVNGSPAITDNSLTGIAGSAILISSGTPTFHTNNLEFNTGTFDLVNNTANAIDASSNWWRTTDPDAIDQRIFDYLDEYTDGQVTYTPLLTGPSQTAPAYVRSLTLDPPSPVGIQTVTFSVEYSRPMDVNKNPQITFGVPVGGTWATKASMPTPRMGLEGTAASNGKIYAIGGWDTHQPFTTVEEYDPMTDIWATRASMPTGRFGLSVVTARNGKIYAIGGNIEQNNGSTVLATVEEYDPVADSWVTRASMPTPRYALGVVTASNGKIYAIGGLHDISLATVEEYDPVADSWTTRASMPTPRSLPGVAAANNGKIYVIGGNNNQGIIGYGLTTVEEYDPAVDTWTTRTNMSTARWAMGVTVAGNGKIYAIGGYNGSVLATVEEYDPVADSWATRASMPTARDSLAAVQASNGKIYTIGGYTGTWVATNEEYTPGTGIEEATANPRWLDSTHYHASYDFTSQNPRGTYPVNTLNALGLDGTVVAPYQAADFVVDYAGYISVSTPPDSPVVSAWGNGSLLTLSAHWTATDPQGAAITGYRYAIGTTPGGTEVVNWTNVTGTSLTRSGLNLTPGQTYYISIKARNEGGLWSLAGSSNGVIAGVVTAPTLASISPNTTLAGSDSFTLTANGSNFTPTSVIRWNGTDLATTFVNSTQQTASVPASLLGTGGSVNVTVFNPGGGETAAQVFTIENPVPTLTDLSTSSVIVGGTGFTLTATGSNFVSNSVIRWGSTDLATTFVSSAQLSASIDAAKVATAGTVNVSVINPTPGGGTTLSLTFTINNPAPSAASLSPDHVTAGAAGFILRVNGTNFASGSVIRWGSTDLATTFVSSTQLTASIVAAEVATAGTVNVTAFTPTQGGGSSSALIFTINNPMPTASKLSPDHVTAGDSSFTLTVNGTGFVSTSVIRWGATDLATTFVSSTQLTASIDSAKVSDAGTVDVTVFNPSPGGGTSSALAFITNNPAPTATLLSPDHVTAGATGFTLTMTGTGFVSTSVIRWGATDLATSFVSSTRLTASIDAAKESDAGTVNVTVFSPNPGGGTTSAMTFNINNPAPTTTSLSPDHVTARAPGFILTLNGSGFVPISVIRWNGADLTTTFVSSAQLTASIDASKVVATGTANVTVFTPTPGGGESSALSFTINAEDNPLPVLTGLDRVKVKVHSSGFTLTVSGTGFVPGSVVRWNGQDLATTYVTDTQITAVVDASRLTSIGMVNITVYTPGPGGGVSSSIELEIEAIKQFMPLVQKTS